MSGNSTGGRMMRDDDDDPALTAIGPWIGEVTGLRLGDVPGEGRGGPKVKRGTRFGRNMSDQS